MKEVTIDEIQGDLCAYLERVQAGETLLVTRNGKPVAEIKPHVARVESLRPFGLCAGQFTVPDDFDAPLPENVLHDFLGE